MVGVAFICCTFVAKIKCHSSKKQTASEYFCQSTMSRSIIMLNPCTVKF